MTKLFTLLRGAWGVVGGWFGGSAWIICAAVLVLCWMQHATLQNEYAAHALTRMERDTAVADGTRWAALARQLNATSGALSREVSACLERESRARADSQRRAAIMNQAKPRPRTEAEKEVVVDDETRRAAADHLNRAW
ncbi:hypothetical protein [Desulfovibrio psychrotolerans]|uniref:Chemotaxis protein n=1 Tax=Desulfovibrio psychrotolerans TaxID=415242 RepID=A0A7J0BWB1_9BACT|nr:hypothetical protein [Desulfovibrio psychrotolerans]GFM37983.1 hypothetical protein DSM19430T_26670 [Desulfovibrio psychrotolerans]